MPESVLGSHGTPRGAQELCAELVTVLNRVGQDGRSRVVLLLGASRDAQGVVLDWLGAYAARQGRMQALRVVHSPLPQLGDGLEGALLEHLGWGDPASQAALEAGVLAVAQERRLGDEDDARSLARLGWPRETLAPSASAERELLLARWVEGLLAAGPLLVLVEDLQRSSATLSALARLVEPGSPTRHGLCVVAALRDEGPGPETHPLREPGLGLEEVRAALRPGGGAQELGVGEGVGPPGRAVPSLDAVLAGVPEPVQRVAERLALAGEALCGQEWAALRPDGEVGLGNPLLLRLAEAGLLLPWRGGWAFRQDRARQQLIARSEAAGRARGHHAAIAQALRGRYGDRVEAQRVARHLLGADQPLEALDLLAGAAAWFEGGATSRVWEQLVVQQERLAEVIGLPPQAPQRVRALLARAVFMRVRGKLDEARSAAERALAAVTQSEAPDPAWHARALIELGAVCLALNDLERAATLLERGRGMALGLEDTQPLARALRGLARLHDRRGDPPRAEAFARELEAVERAGGHRERLALALEQLGVYLRQQGRYDEAYAACAEAEVLARGEGSCMALARAVGGMGDALESAGRLAEAAPLLERALDMYLRQGQSWAAAYATNSLAEIARKTGDIPRAEALYRAAIDRYERAGNAESYLPRINLALVLLGRGLVREARELLELALVSAEEARRASGVVAILTIALPCYAAERAWKEWDDAYQRVAPAVLSGVLVDPDLAWAAELSGEWVASAARQPRDLERAARSWELALLQRVALQDTQAVERARAQLLALAVQGSPIPLGPFNLDRARGQGGLGTVWQGRHRAQGVSVAIKVLTAASSSSRKALAAFQQEVRAVAGLDHAGIVMVLDTGLVSEAASIMARGALTAGSPYLGMQFYHGGSLAAWCGRTPWDAVRRVLLDLLAALGHAHSRGVIHRDIKPANVMLQRANDFAGGVVLTDFGIAHALREGQHGFVAAGTPEYMAPEQFTTDWRMHGPWTDLYALGCLAVALVQGEPPFVGEGPEALREAHCWHEPPPLKPVVQVPAGFEAWVRRLLQKRPQDRFVVAADAAWALERLGSAVGPQDPTPPTLPTEHGVRTFLFDELDLPDSVGTPERRPAVVPWTPAVPPVPVDWRPRHQRPAQVALQGAGLGLFGLREPPLVGREAERDRLWSTLLTTLDQGGARGVLLRGPAGVGKSRLGRWLAERAYVLGQAVLFRVEHAAGQHDALARALAQRLRCDGLEPLALRMRLEGWAQDQAVTDPALLDTLAQVVTGQLAADTPEGSLAVSTAIAALSRVRPVMVILDEVGWGEATLRALHPALCGEVHADAGLLVVMSARDERLTEEPGAAAALEALVAAGLVEELRLGPLPEEVRPSLVSGLLDLEHSLLSLVVARTEGNPAFATALVGDWVRRDLLQPGAVGFQLRPGSTTLLPPEVSAEWGARLERLGLRRGRVYADALELGSVFGETELDAAAWRSACLEAGLRLPPDALEVLDREALVQVDAAGTWCFVHPMLRESAEQAAEQRGVAATWRRAWARLLERRGQEQDRARVAMLRMRSGQPEQALDPVRAAVRRQVRAGRPDEAAELVELWEEALRAVGVARDDARWGELWLSRAEVCMERGYYPEQGRLAQRVLDQVRRFGWAALAPQALWLRAVALYEGGQWEQAWASLVDARERFRDQDDANGVARCLRDLGRLARAMGRLEEAEEYMEEALGAFRELEDWRYIGRVLQDQGSLLTHRQNIEQSEQRYQEALSCFRRSGYLLGEGECLNNLGELHRYQGRLDLAESTYRRAAALYRMVNTTRVLVPQLNLGLVLLARDQFEDARRLFGDMVPDVQRNGSHMLRLFLNGFRLAAAHPEDPHWDELYRPVAQALSGSDLAEADIAWPLELAANRARRLRRPERARALYALARAQWHRLGVADAVQRVEEAERAVMSTRPGF